MFIQTEIQILQDKPLEQDTITWEEIQSERMKLLNKNAKLTLGDPSVSKPVSDTDERSRTFVNDWLSKRRDILRENIRTYDKMRNPDAYAVYTDERVSSELERQLYNMNNAFLSVDNKAVIGGNNGQFDRKNNMITLSNVKLDTKAENPELDRTLTHERTHSLRAFPQEQSIKALLGKHYIRNEKDSDIYTNRSDEIYARLMAFRKANNIRPDQVVTKDDIKKWSRGLIDNELGQYPTKFLIELFNTIASNQIPNNKNSLNTNLLT